MFAVEEDNETGSGVDTVLATVMIYLTDPLFWDIKIVACFFLSCKQHDHKYNCT